MMFGFKFLSDVCGVNSFTPVRELRFIKGNQEKIYFQLCTTSASGQSTRYIPQGSDSNTIIVNFDSLDDDRAIQRTATQAFADDKSIYCVTVGAGDCIAYDGMTLEIQEVSLGVTKTICALPLGELVVVPKGQDARFV